MKNRLHIPTQYKLTILLVYILFVGCSTEKRCMRHIEKAKKLGCLTFTDSVNIRDSVSIYLDSQVVVSSVDSILNIIACDSLTDTLYLTRVKERIKTIVSNIPCEISPTIHANKDYSLKIWSKGGKLFYNLKIEPKPEKVCKEVKWWDNFIDGFIAGVLFIVLLFHFALKYKTRKY